MKPRNHDEARDLTDATRDAAAKLDAEIAATRPAPDFSAMLARARELAPDVVSEADVERAAALAPVIPLGRGHGQPGRDDAAALAPFNAALRAELDAKIAERRMASIPPPPLPAPRRWTAAAIGLAVAVAAALLLVIVRPGRLAQGSPRAAVEANAAGESSPRGEARPGEAPEKHVLWAIERGEPPVPADSSTVADRAAPADTSASALNTPAIVPSDSAGEPAPSDSVPPVRAARRAAPRRSRPADARPEPAAPGPSLEDEAQALWERGELAAAEGKYRELLAVAGRGARAELAYGDLFALVRQLRGADGQADVWREYLERFPAGRFAEDALAGLCLRAAADARSECWRDYLEHHPRGIHRGQAEAVLAAQEEIP